LKGERACEGDSQSSQGGVSDAEAEHFSSILEFEGLRLFPSLQSSDGITHGFSLLHRNLSIRWGWVIAVAGNIPNCEDITTVVKSQISVDD
jgi:hypothetical protein